MAAAAKEKKRFGVLGGKEKGRGNNGGAVGRPSVKRGMETFTAAVDAAALRVPERVGTRAGGKLCAQVGVLQAGWGSMKHEAVKSKAARKSSDRRVRDLEHELACERVRIAELE